MFKWIKKLFEPPVDQTELEVKSVFQFLIDDYSFAFAKSDLGNLVDENGKLIFYGPLYVYQIFNDSLCINIVNLVQRGDFDVYITEKRSQDQHFIFDGLHISSHLAHHLHEFANEIKAELLNGRTLFGKNV